MDSAEFHAAVYHVIRQIPTQRVTTYGHVAKLVGMPKNARHVGQALKFLSPNTQPPVPWHRVISASGAISSRGPGTDGARRQRDALVAEGVEVTERGGEMRVSTTRWGWFPTEVDLPDSAPSLENSGDEDEDEDEDEGDDTESGN